MGQPGSTAVVAPPTSGRGGLLFRLGAVIVGAAAAATLADQRRAEAAPTPTGCVGPGQCANCSNYPRQGCCCWYVNVPGTCRIIMCCDRHDDGLCDNCTEHNNCNCICPYTVCTVCC